MSDDRPTGYYWVRQERLNDALGPWEVALWENEGWWLFSRDWQAEDDEVAFFVGPLVTPPA